MAWRAAMYNYPAPTYGRLKASLKEPDLKTSGSKLFKNLVDELCRAFPTLRKVSEYTTNTDNYGDAAGRERGSIMFTNDTCGLEIEFDGDREVEFDVVSIDQAEFDALLKFWSKNTTKRMPRGRVHVVVSTPDGPEFKSIGVGAEKLERGNYTDEVLAGYDRIVRDLQAKEPSGRIAIMNGAPGTGKTYLVRGLLDEVDDAIMIVVPSNMVAELAQPGMLPSLVDLHAERERPLVFIIEDADECLASRAGDNMSAISVMLNMGDGLLGKILDVRIVCTTNAGHDDLDEAITRPGRLSTEIEVGQLDAKKAAEVYKRLTGEDRDIGRATLAEVYQLARDKGWQPAARSATMGFQLDSKD